MTTIEEVRDALISADGSMRLVQTFDHGIAVQVYRKTRKVGPLLFPVEGETLADVLRMLGGLVLDETKVVRP